MKIRRFKTFFTSSTARLSGTYLLIIMIMSLGFSVMFYHTSSDQLGRQIPPDSTFSYYQRDGQTAPVDANGNVENQGTVKSPQLKNFFKERVTEGRSALLRRLIILNIGALILGALVSYALARRSLKPIEDAMEAQVQFVSDASHELRTPLTAIQTSNEVFLRRVKPKISDAKQLIEQNTQDIARLKQLSDGLLNLAQHKKSNLTFESVKVQSALSEAIAQIVPQITEKDLAVHDKTGDIAVFAEPAALAQVLVILLDNAAKYSDDGKNISITTRLRGKHVYISVEDEGIGIRASDMPHLFRRFYRADNARTGGDRVGYGLGLAIAKQIVESMHGTIEVKSTLGKGSTFTIKLTAAS